MGHLLLRLHRKRINNTIKIMHTITSPQTIMPAAPIVLIVSITNNARNANMSVNIVSITIFISSFHNTVCKLCEQEERTKP